jgi:hypothetical protein
MPDRPSLTPAEWLWRHSRLAVLISQLAERFELFGWVRSRTAAPLEDTFGVIRDKLHSAPGGTMHAQDYSSRFGRWLKEPDKLKVEECVCSWTDLLGFSNTFIDSSWSPSKEEWARLIHRVARANRTFSFSGINELKLTLNDGIVQVKRPGRNPLAQISHWLRDVVLAHWQLNELESADGLPGARTVVTAGQKVLYTSIEEVKLDDLVLDYTRTRPGLSRLAEDFGNRTVVLNPELLQMNIAFSKAYLLDSFGSKQGISGPKFFVDESLFQYVEKLVSKAPDRYSLIRAVQDDSWLFAVAYTSVFRYPWALGIRCESPVIKVNTGILKTTVRQVRAFYPYDEDPAQFQFDL